MEQFRFLNWQVYKDAKILLARILKISKQLPHEYRFEFSNQLIKAALSVVLNIAEGSGKSSDKELNRYLGICLGSVYEIIAEIDVLKDNNLITKKEAEEIYKQLCIIANQLGGFKKNLKAHCYKL